MVCHTFMDVIHSAGLEIDYKDIFIVMIRLLVLLIPCMTFSQLNVDILLGTRHHYRTYMYESEIHSFNEFNPGILVSNYIGEKTKVGIGFYHNSYRKFSSIYTLGRDLSKRLEIGVGVATGYKNTDMNKVLLPIGIINYKIGPFKLGLTPQFFLLGISL